MKRPTLTQVYDAMMKIGKDGNTTYPDCTGLVISMPSEGMWHVINGLVAEGKFVLAVGRTGEPVMCGISS